MNIQKLIAIVLAVLINCVVLAWFQTWSTVAAANAATVPARADKVQTLPTVTVRPTREQIEMLHHRARPARTSHAAPLGDAGMRTLVMPFYSFAGTSDSVGSG